MKSYTREQVDEAMATCSAVIPKYARDSVLDKLDTPEPEKSFVEKYRSWYDYLATTPNLTRKEISEGYAQLIEEMVDRKNNALANKMMDVIQSEIDRSKRNP